jgi:hypothetical protein
LKLTLNRAVQDDDDAIEGASEPALEQLPRTTFTRNELDVSHPDLFAQAFAVLQGVTESMDLHTHGLADKTQDIVAMAHARIEEDADVVVEDVSSESPIHPKQTKKNPKRLTNHTSALKPLRWSSSPPPTPGR